MEESLKFRIQQAVEEHLREIGRMRISTKELRGIIWSEFAPKEGQEKFCFCLEELKGRVFVGRCGDCLNINVFLDNGEAVGFSLLD